MFNKFHHLFEYDATYYSYLIAKLASQRIYQNKFNNIDEESYKLSDDVKDLFEKGGFVNLRTFNL